MLSSTTKKKIDTARDVLVGKIPMPTSQVEQITLALIYKFMSDMDKKTKDLGDTSGFFANGYEKYAWDHLMDKSLPARDRVLLYREALEKMALNPHIPQLFRDIFRNASLPFNDPETLKLFLEVINQFEYDHSEELGNAFEYLLQVMGSQGDAGQFRTPRHIIDFIVEVVDPQKTDKILDPACGTAGFLISAYNHLRKNGLTNAEMDQVSENFVGYDISQDMQRLSLVNMYLHHFPDPHIYEYDTLTSEERWDEDFDVILANPPFMTPKGGIKPHNRFSVPSKRAEVLFVDYIMEHLTINGKAGVIVPEGIIFQSQNAYKNLRKMMVDDDYLWAVVSLPSGVFQPYSGVKTNILFFDKSIAKTKNSILYAEVKNTGISLGATNAVIEENDLPQVMHDLLAFKVRDELLESEVSWLAKKKEIRDQGYDLRPSLYKPKVKSDSRLEYLKLRDVALILKGKSSSTKTDEGIYPLVVTAENPRSASHFDFDGNGVAVPLISALGHGKAQVKRVHRVKGKFALANLLAFVEPNPQKVNPDYLKYILDGNKDGLANLMKGSANVSMKVEDLEQFVIPVPELEEQEVIAEEIDRYQKIIGGARHVVESYRIDFEMQKEWDEYNLGDICDFKNGLNFTKSSSGQEIRVIGVKDFKDRLFAPTDNLDTIQVDGELNPDYLLESNDILFVRSNGNKDLVGRSMILPEFEDKISFSGFTIRARLTNSKVNPIYLAYLFKTKLFREKMKSLGRGANIRNLNQEILKQITVPVPSLEEQEIIIEKLQLESDVFSQFERVAKEYEAKIKKRVNKIWGK